MDKDESVKIVSHWLKDISKTLGTELSLNEDRTCTFQIGEDVIIGIEVAEEVPLVSIYSPLVQFPTENPDLINLMLIRALELNAFQVLTRGGAIALPSGGGPLIYCFSIPVEGTDVEKFSKILAEFYETIPHLREMVTKTDKLDNSFQNSRSINGNQSGFIKI